MPWCSPISALPDGSRNAHNPGLITILLRRLGKQRIPRSFPGRERTGRIIVEVLFALATELHFEQTRLITYTIQMPPRVYRRVLSFCCSEFEKTCILFLREFAR